MRLYKREIVWRALVLCLIPPIAALVVGVVTFHLAPPAADAGIPAGWETSRSAHLPSIAGLPFSLAETPTATVTSSLTPTPMVTSTPITGAATPTATASPTPPHQYVYLPVIARQWAAPKQCSVLPAGLPSQSTVLRRTATDPGQRGSKILAASYPGPAEGIQAGAVPAAIDFVGRVTAHGVVTSGVKLALEFYDGSQWVTYGFALTDANGNYTFSSVPAPGQNQKYYVSFSNEANHAGPQYLKEWQCNLVSYPAVASPYRCDFDLAAIALQSPPGLAALLSPPATFRWTPRPATPGDGYEFSLSDAGTAQPLYRSGNLGNTGVYTLQQIPPGLSSNTPYLWAPNVFNAFGIGWGYEARVVRFDQYLEDFANPSSAWPWPVGDSDTLTVAYLEGEYDILLKPTHIPFVPYFALSPSGYATSYAIDVDVRLTSDAPGAYGLIFGSTTIDQYYGFWVGPTLQQYIVLKHTQNQDEPWSILVAWSDSTAIWEGPSSNHLQVIRRGSGIEVCANGLQLASVQDANYTGWQSMGLSLIPFQEDYVEARFDNFQVRVLESGPVGEAAVQNVAPLGVGASFVEQHALPRP